MKTTLTGGKWSLVVYILLIYVFFLPEEMYAEMLSATNTIKPIQIEITTHLGDEQTFVEGDTISFLLNLDSDAYLLVIYQDAAGNLIQLIPNRDSRKVRYKAGMFISLPDNNDPFRFRVEPPFGDETIWVFASDVPAPELNGKILENGLKLLDTKLKKLLQKLRKQSQTAFGESHLSIHTRAQ